MRMTEEKLQSLIGQTVKDEEREYTLIEINIDENTAKLRDDKTGWYPMFKSVPLRDLVEQNIDMLLDEKEKQLLSGVFPGARRFAIFGR